MDKEKVTPIEGLIIKQKGVFDFNTLYSGIAKFLKEYGYMLHEQEHTEKSKPLGKEIKVKFTANKELDNTLRKVFEIELHLKKTKEEAELLSGEIRIRIHAYIAIDYKEIWTSTRYRSLLYNVSKKYTRKSDIKHYAKQLQEDLKDLTSYMKLVLGLED